MTTPPTPSPVLSSDALDEMFQFDDEELQKRKDYKDTPKPVPLTKSQKAFKDVIEKKPE